MSSGTFDLFGLGLVLASNLVLGFIVFYGKPKSLTSKLFLLLTLSISLYSVCTYLINHIANIVSFLWVLRFTMFSAVLFATSFFLLALNFPSDTWLSTKKQLYGISTLSVITLILTLTPTVFQSASLAQGASLPSPHTGWGIILFGFTVFVYDIGGLWMIIKRSMKSTGIEKIQQRYLLVGFLITICSILIFSFILPVVFNNTFFVPISVFFTLPFVAFTAYAIIRHHLLDVKVISTEILVFILAIVTLLEVINSQNLTTRIFRLSEFALVLIFGVFLIQSVLKEVRQREQLQSLTTELGKANEQLKNLDQARADFITLTSHQLRTPPATIKWYLAAIKTGDYGELSDGVKEAITKTEITNNALISLIDDLLNASRIERGKMEFLFEPVHIDELAKFTVEQLTPQAGFKKLSLTYIPPAVPIPEVLADKEKLRQVINNFIDNAIKYTPKGEVKVRVEADDTYVSVLVSDSGKGIAPEVMPALFEKYSRGKDSVMHATGIGIGLYVAKVVIENHEGLIGAKSPGVNQGATFYFKLPIHSKLPQTKVMDLVKEQQNNPNAHT